MNKPLLGWGEPEQALVGLGRAWTSPYIYDLWVLFADEFRGFQLLSAAEEGDINRLKKILTIPIINFQDPLSLDSALV